MSLNTKYRKTKRSRSSVSANPASSTKSAGSPAGRHTFEVDEFFGENEGLVVAEVELGSEDEAFERPDFLGKEVTGDRRYYNSSLRIRPYSQWEKE